MTSEAVGVVLAGGDGVNLAPLTPYIDKHLISILGKPLVYYPASSIVSLGIRRLFVIARDESGICDVLRRMLGEIDIACLKARRTLEETLEALALELHNVETVIISFGDVVMPIEAYRLAFSAHLSSGQYVTILISPLPDVRGYYEVNTIGGISIMKQDLHRPGYAWTGVLIAESEFLKALLESKGDLNKAFSLIKGVNLAYWSGWFVDVTYPWDILQCVRQLLDGLQHARISKDADISPKAVIEGPVIVEDNARIDHGAIIRGPVYIGRGAYVGTNALIRNYTSLEEGSSIGAISEVSESWIGRNATIGRGCFLGNSVVGDESVIEPGFVSLNVLPSGVELSHLTPIIIKGRKIVKLGVIIGPKARVGANSVAFAGSMVEANTYIPPLSTLRPGA